MLNDVLKRRSETWDENIQIAFLSFPILSTLSYIAQSVLKKNWKKAKKDCKIQILDNTLRFTKSKVLMYWIVLFYNNIIWGYQKF